MNKENLFIITWVKCSSSNWNLNNLLQTRNGFKVQINIKVPVPSLARQGQKAKFTQSQGGVPQTAFSNRHLKTLYNVGSRAVVGNLVSITAKSVPNDRIILQLLILERII